MPTKTNNATGSLPVVRWGDRVAVCDCARPGRVTFIWDIPPEARARNPAPKYYRVEFAMGSPFIGDYAIYRAGELTPWIEKPALTDLNVVDAMRPKIPKRNPRT